MADSQAAPTERIAKRIARAGICSRREAERMIAEGRVSVDGRMIDSPALNVTDRARIKVDGKVVAAPEKTRLWRFHKPVGIICTQRDPQGRPTVFDRLPSHMPRVVSVGRLDINSEGLLLLTNDGALSRKLELPANAWRRRYRVRVYGKIENSALSRLADGMTVDGVQYGSIRAVVDREQGANSWLSISITEGKNREVRNVMAALGLQVSRLIRTAHGPFQLGALKPGDIAEVPGKVLGEQLGEQRRETLSAGRRGKN